jgi:hypothetical protein
MPKPSTSSPASASGSFTTAFVTAAFAREPVTCRCRFNDQAAEVAYGDVVAEQKQVRTAGTYA